MSNYLHNLQNADDATKRRYGLGIAAVVMLLVVYVWLAYFNTLVAPTKTVSDAGTGAESDAGFSLWETARQETGAVYGAFKGKLGKLKAIVSAPKNYAIQPVKFQPVKLPAESPQ